MNFKLYIFGKLSGYMQYPDDSVSFEEYCGNRQSRASLNIKRKADLVYYVYTQNIDDESYLGFCLVFNGVYVKQTKDIFGIFEKACSDCVFSGRLFKIGQNGKLIFATDDFGSRKDEFDRISGNFNDELEIKGENFFSLLPKTYKQGSGHKSFSISDGAEEINEAISNYDTVSILCNNNTDTDYVSRQIKKLYDENLSLKNRYETLNKQKKQYKWVAILSILVIGCLIWLYFLNDSLSGVISDQSLTINSMEDTIRNKDYRIVSLGEELSKVRSSLKLVEDELSSFKTTFPINITNIEIGNSYENGNIETDYGKTIYSENTMYLKPNVSYTGIDVGSSINLKIRWYRPDGTLSAGIYSPAGFSQQFSLYVNKGNNITVFPGWGSRYKGYWEKGTYRIEIWYENVCLRSETFNVY